MENGNQTKVRCFNGYHQHIEARYVGNQKIVNRWVFYVCGFNGDCTIASVLRSDGGKDYVPIDKSGRILLNGKRYSRAFWNH